MLHRKTTRHLNKDGNSETIHDFEPDMHLQSYCCRRSVKRFEMIEISLNSSQFKMMHSESTKACSLSHLQLHIESNRFYKIILSPGLL